MTLLPRTGPRIGIYGGTFDPVHMGHLHAAEVFLRTCSLDRLYILPTGITPHKQVRADDDPRDRLHMLEIAFSHPDYADPRIVVSDYEQKQTGKSYTILTLEHFREESGNLFLLCGTDMFLTLPKWYRGDEILQSTSIVCLERTDDPEQHTTVLAAAKQYREEYGTEVFLPPFSPIEISSTEIRRRIQANESTEGLLLPAVRAYIDDKNLYR